MGTRTRPTSPLRIHAEALRWAILAAVAAPVGGLASGCAGWEWPETGSRGAGPTEPPPPLPACEEPEPYAHPGSGYESCAGGFVHRAHRAECETSAPRDGVFLSSEFGNCQADADCTDAPHGYCTQGFDSEGRCVYGCATDSDCEDDRICLCGAPAGRCVPAECKSDADCAPGSLCTAQVGSDCGLTERFACQKRQDHCFGSADCEQYEVCVRDYGDSDVRTCVPMCVYGRPFYIQEELRRATLRPGNDWLGSHTVFSGAELAPELSAADRELLSRHYAEVGLMEHASVAAFARFALQLLQLGAPAELVSAATSAQQDEVRHAQAAFSLAQHFAGSGRGPGPLEVKGALGEGLECIVRGAVIEGCLGETLASLEASLAHGQATYPLVRETLEGVADDERRHAELAWRFVGWALQQAEGSPRLARKLARVVEQAFDDGITALLSQPCPDAPEALHAYGMLGREQLKELRSRAIEEVIEPCRRALFATDEGDSAAAASCRNRAAAAFLG